MKQQLSKLSSFIQSILNHPIFIAIDQFCTPAFLILNLYSLLVIIRHFTSIDPSEVIDLFILYFPVIMTVLYSYYLFTSPFWIITAAILVYLNSSCLNAFLIPVLLYYLEKLIIHLKEKHFLTNLPQFVENSLKDLLTLLICILLITSIRYFPNFNFLISLTDSSLFMILIVFIHCLLFYNGIHPVFLKYFLYPIEIVFLFENVTHFYLEIPLTHLLTHGLISAMCNLSGTGITFGIALLDHSLPAGSIINSFFGVNEPVLFGLPIVKNKQAFVPYVLGGTLLGSIPILLIKTGYLNYPVFDAPYIGLGLEGVLVNLDWKSLIVALIQIIGSVMIWLPYYLKEKKKHEI